VEDTLKELSLGLFYGAFLCADVDEHAQLCFADGVGDARTFAVEKMREVDMAPRPGESPMAAGTQEDLNRPARRTGESARRVGAQHLRRYFTQERNGDGHNDGPRMKPPTPRPLSSAKMLPMSRSEMTVRLCSRTTKEKSAPVSLKPLDRLRGLVFLLGQVLDADATDAHHRYLDRIYEGEGDQADDKNTDGQLRAQAANVDCILLRREDRQAN